MTKPAPIPLQGTDQALAKTYDVALLDLDGVVYRGKEPVDHAASALAAVREQGMRLSFVTNNALRPPEEVVQRIRAAGVEAQADQVVTSAQAAARLLAEQLDRGARVLVAGGAGLRQAVSERGFVALTKADEDPAAVVSGYDPELTYARLAEAVLAINGGALWVASNTDATVPTERGLLPGAGALVAFIATATKVRPQVAGKPERALHEEATSRSGARSPLVVGDRLDTDIAGANAVGAPSLLVLTGVATAADLLDAPLEQRPTFLGGDLRALLRPAPPVVRHGSAQHHDSARCGSWCVTLTGGELEWAADADSDGDPQLGDDGLDAFRAGLSLHWALTDAGQRPTGVRGDAPAGCEAFVTG